MKNLLFGIMFLMLTNVTGYSKNTITVDVFNKNFDPTYIAVGKLIEESNRVYSRNDISTFFTEEFVILCQKTNLTREELRRFATLSDAGISRLLASDSNFANAYSAVVNLRLTKQDFVRNVDLYFTNNPSSKAVVPNKKACGVSMASGGFLGSYLGYIGMQVHC